MDRPNSLSDKGLGRSRPAAVALSPYVATTYDDFFFLENNLFLLKKNA